MVDNSWGMVHWSSMVNWGSMVDKGSVVDTVGNSMMGSMVGKPMVDTVSKMVGSMVGKSMVDTMSKMVGSMVSKPMVDTVSKMVGSSMVTMETSMVDGGNNRMGSGMTSMSSMSNSVNSKAIFVDGLMAMLGRSS